MSNRVKDLESALRLWMSLVMLYEKEGERADGRTQAALALKTTQKLLKHADEERR